jgi:hypothetical protein
MMANRYPVKAELDEWGDPSRVGLFSPVGYWHSVDGVHFEFAPDQTELASLVARAINRAYEDGQQNARNQMREALGLEWVE